ncbi:MAG: hypothetical protein Q9182_002068 [Xanthomendoza sp. 2 TL-2023]
MTRDLSYPREPGNTVHRLSQRGKYDLHTVHSIVNSTSVLHVSFNAADSAQGPFPAILPMIGQMGSFSYPSSELSDTLDCYLHGYISARLMKLAREDPAQGLPVTIAATKCDGLVLSLTPFSHSYNYRSAVLFGYASAVEEDEEKLWAMRLITNSVVQNRWEHARLPAGAELSTTTILRVRIVSASAKVRDGEPHDDKKDLERPEVTDKIWTGVVPMWETLGEPVASGNNRVGETPEHIRLFVDKMNNNNKKYAQSVTRDA